MRKNRGTAKPGITREQRRRRRSKIEVAENGSATMTEQLGTGDPRLWMNTTATASGKRSHAKGTVEVV